MIDNLIYLAFFLGPTFIGVLLIKYLVHRSKNQKAEYLSTGWKMITYSIVIIYCLVSFSFNAIIVEISSNIISQTYKESMSNFKHWILFKDLKTGLIGAGLIILLTYLNIVYQNKTESKVQLNIIYKNLAINLIILLLSVALTHAFMYASLANEVARYFN
jgi:hypothetical protein